jgi:hypothetical protein
MRRALLEWLEPAQPLTLDDVPLGLQPPERWPLPCRVTEARVAGASWSEIAQSYGSVKYGRPSSRSRGGERILRGAAKHLAHLSGADPDELEGDVLGLVPGQPNAGIARTLDRFFGKIVKKGEKLGFSLDDLCPLDGFPQKPRRGHDRLS